MILCCGEALIDMLPRETAAGEACFVPHGGGAMFNTAIALGRLGAPAGLLCGLSQDAFGAQLAAALRQSKVDTRYCPRSHRATTLAFVTLHDGQARYTFYDENSAGRMLRVADLPILDETVDALLLGGIALLQEPCGAAYEALATREAANRVIVVDPNIRRDFIPDETAYRARLKRLLACADMVKLSDEDLDWLAPRTGDAPHHAFIDGLLKSGVALVAVTRGSAGADAHTAHVKVSVPARRASVIDTIGAGDTFNAAILASLRQQGLLRKQALATAAGAQIETALRFANKAAAISVARAGANPPWADELD